MSSNYFAEFYRKINEEGIIDLHTLSPDEMVVLEPFSFWFTAKNRLITLKVDGVKQDLRPEDFLLYHVFECEILSCRPRFVAVGDLQRPRLEYRGKLRLNGESFTFRAARPVEPGRQYVAAKPMFEKKKHVVFEVLHTQRVDPLENVEPLQPQSLQDVRGLYPSIVGEDVNVFLAVLSLVSRLNLNRDFWVMGMVVQGLSSAGKSYFMKNILRPWTVLERVEEFTRMTGAYLERKFAKKNVDNMVFAIYELPEDTPQQLHLTLSEGRLRVGVVDRETGEAVEYNFEGIPFLFSTTPLESLRADIRNRVIVTSIDESDEQTRRVLEYETWRAADPVRAAQFDKEVEELSKRFAKYLMTLKPCRVRIPFAGKLLERIKFSNVKLRRDWRKLLSLIQASAILFQGQRPQTMENGELVVTATVEDLWNVLQVMPAFRQTLQNVTEQQRRVLEVMQKNTDYTTNQIVHALWDRGWRVSAYRIRSVLNELEMLGYVIIRRDLGKENHYEKLADPESIDFTEVAEELTQEPGPENPPTTAPETGGPEEGVETPEGGVENDLKVSGSTAQTPEISGNRGVENTEPADTHVSLACQYGDHAACWKSFTTFVETPQGYTSTTVMCKCSCHS